MPVPPIYAASVREKERMDKVPPIVSQAISQLDPLWNRLIKPATVVLTGVALVIGIAGFIIQDPMNGSAMISIAISFIIFYILMSQLGENFRLIWSRDVLHTRSSEDDGKGKEPLGDTENTDGVLLEPETFAQFLRGLSSRLNHRAQWILGIGFSLIGVISWRFIYFLLKGSFFRVQPYSDLCRELGPGISQIIYYTAFVSEIAIGIFVGLLAWRMVIIAMQIRCLDHEFVVRPQLRHPDCAGGLKPLGNLCLLNGTILTIPSIYLAGWIICAPTLYPERYGHRYTSLYLILVFVTVSLAMIALFVPLRGVHRIMVATRGQIKPSIEKIGQEIQRLSKEILEQAVIMDDEGGEKTAKKLSFIQKVYQDHQRLPVWPFQLRVLILQQIIPIAGSIIGLMDSLPRLMHFLFPFWTS